MRYLNHPILESVVKGRRDLKTVVNKEVRPNRTVMRLIGHQIIEGFKGGHKLSTSNLHFTPSGGVVGGRSFTTYPRGIYKGISPKGTPYKELAESTIALKKRHHSRYAERPLIDHALMVNGLRYEVSSNKRAVRVYFADPETDRISRFQERGTGDRQMTSESLSKGRGGPPRMVKVPARPHRGVQPEVVRVIGRILQVWANRNEKK